MSRDYNTQQLNKRYIQIVKEISNEFNKSPEEIKDLLDINQYKKFVDVLGIDSWNLGVVSRYHLITKM